MTVKSKKPSASKKTPAKKATAAKKAVKSSPKTATAKTPKTKAKPPAKAKKAQSSAEQPKVENQKTDINFSSGLAHFFEANNVSIALTSYQTGRLYIFGRGESGKLAMHEAGYTQAMGIVGNSQRLYLGTLTQIVRLENVLSPGQIANGQHDVVYVPRNMQTTGHIDIHEIGIRNDGVMVFINTKFGCLCEPSTTHSFKPIWKPKFISKIAPEDRCHLNGLAMVDGRPKYVTAVCKSDVVDGWRDRRHDGGIIIDVETDEIVAEGLSMPHSPRWYNGKLWVLNSGSGELGWIDMKTKAFNAVAFFPGFLRGLSFHNGHAIVTLSKPRHGRFEGLELDQKLKEKDADAWCGIQVLNLQSGDIVNWIRFDGHIIELFDVCALPGVKNALTLGPNSQEIKDFITYETV